MRRGLSQAALERFTTTMLGTDSPIPGTGLPAIPTNRGIFPKTRLEGPGAPTNVLYRRSPVTRQGALARLATRGHERSGEAPSNSVKAIGDSGGRSQHSVPGTGMWNWNVGTGCLAAGCLAGCCWARAVSAGCCLLVGVGGKPELLQRREFAYLVSALESVLASMQD